MKIFQFNFVQGGMLGFIIAAVSPAVIVPAMLNFMERGLGGEKRDTHSNTGWSFN